MTNDMFTHLRAPGPHPSLGAHADTYGRVLGSWRGEVHSHMTPGAITSASLEVHFAWVLEGRAVQDVWITPARADRDAGRTGSLDWYGTTLRVFDPASESWRATWFNPVTGLVVHLEGRRQGDDIVQIGTRGGRPIRWTFSEIGARSLRWQGHILEADGFTWKLEVDVHLQRIGERQEGAHHV